MTITPRTRIAAALGAAALLTAGPATTAFARSEGPVIDYSKNAVSGRFTPAKAPVIDYSKNSVSGQFTPRTGSLPAPSVSPTATPGGDGFSWADAAAGAGVGFLIAASAAGGRTVVRRRRLVAS